MMRLNYSSISTYQTCPLQYKLQYIEKIPRKPSYALSFGDSLHKTIEYFYSVPYPKPYSLEQILDHLKKVWRSDGYASRSEEEAHFNHALQVLTIFYQSNLTDFQLPVAIEYRFELKIDNLTLTGKIDKMDKLKSGGFEITDFKTNRRLPPLQKIRADLQLSIYHLAAQHIWGVEPEKLTHYFLLPNQKVSTTRSQEQIEETLNIIRSIAEDITAEIFNPHENNLCPWCDYQCYCPLYRHQYIREEEATTAEAETEYIEKIIDEYVELKKQDRELSQRISELQERIHKYCEENNLSRLYSNRAMISRTTREKYTYDLNRLREILEPLHLWEKVIKVDSKSLKEMVEKENFTEEIKRAIETSRQVEEISYALYLRELQTSNT